MNAATDLGGESSAEDVHVAVLHWVCGVGGLSEIRKCSAWGGVVGK